MTTIIRIAAECLIVGYLIFLSVYDIRHHKVTDKSLLWFTPVVLVKCVTAVCFGTFSAVIPMLLGAAFGFSLLLIAAMVTHGGIGGGDIKLAGILGFAAGLKGMILLLCTSSVGAVLYGLACRMLKKEEKLSIPFVPFMTAGYVLAAILKFIL